MDNQGEVIAMWGGAKLVRTIDLKYKLVGGTPEDREEARKWLAVYFRGTPIEGN